MRRQLTVPDGVVAASRELLADGLSVVMVTLGARGAIGVTENHGVWWARPPKVSVVSAVGSGDAFLAGFAAASMERKDFSERMRLATACGAANASSFGACQFTREKLEEILPEVKLERLDEADTESAEDQPSP